MTIPPSIDISSSLFMYVCHKLETCYLQNYRGFRSFLWILTNIGRTRPTVFSFKNHLTLRGQGTHEANQRSIFGDLVIYIPCQNVRANN